MSSEIPDRLTPFHDKAIAQGIPVADVERWLAIARPCATLTPGGDGPVVGRFGGPLLLPADTPVPVHPFIASIDLAALPTDATDLPLPSDGHLLLFGFPEDDTHDRGGVVHVPAGATVVERDKHFSSGHDVDVDDLPQGPLVALSDVSLPYHGMVSLPEEPWRPLPGHPRSQELVDVWNATCREIDFWGSLQIGGYSNQEAVGTDPVADAMSEALEAAEAGRLEWSVSGDVSDWVLLADWHLEIQGIEGATVHWSIQREDLVARRFDRTITTMYWNP